ncbi:helix-turn-helix transcriptional regulator [Agrobacterium salinitolerans]|uniref:helix-turn-helix transcriptional regulator n=1 Tax=Agrobacterium salinitolerans TaxID=1183413 RepID=UPI0022B8144F|nr:DNA-binding protein [Agrobacterium salinitolerans]MCZ7857065.1 DNA-binding protein [Agrobacterium salinitolerans]MCZ7885845.1 DNA-binding protein [Agrobacterium salinitolerans]
MTAQNLLNSRQLKDRLGGITDMTLWRWSRRPDLDFPKPLVIARRKYWDIRDVDAFIERQRSDA